MLANDHRPVSQGWGKKMWFQNNKEVHCGYCRPWNDALRFFSRCGTEIGNLRCFELSEGRFSSQGPVKEVGELVKRCAVEGGCALSNSTRRIRRVELCKRLHIVQSLVIDAIRFRFSIVRRIIT